MIPYDHGRTVVNWPTLVRPRSPEIKRMTPWLKHKPRAKRPAALPAWCLYRLSNQLATGWSFLVGFQSLSSELRLMAF